jgi:hypothetical protein
MHSNLTRIQVLVMLCYGPVQSSRDTKHDIHRELDSCGFTTSRPRPRPLPLLLQPNLTEPLASASRVLIILLSCLGTVDDGLWTMRLLNSMRQGNNPRVTVIVQGSVSKSQLQEPSTSGVRCQRIASLQEIKTDRPVISHPGATVEVSSLCNEHVVV